MDDTESRASDKYEQLPLAPSAENIPEFVVESDGTAPTWGKSAYRLKARLDASPHTNRFSVEWSRRKQAQILSADEHLRSFVESTALLTFTASQTYPDRETVMPPTAQLSALTSSRPARRRALRRALDEVGSDRWATLRVVAPHDSGFAHTHTAVCADVELSQEALSAVVRAHTRSCPTAREESHDPEDAIRMELDPSATPLGAVSYTTAQIPGMRRILADEDSGQLSDRSARLGATLEATRTQAVRVDTAPQVKFQW